MAKPALTKTDRARIISLDNATRASVIAAKLKDGKPLSKDERGFIAGEKAEKPPNKPNKQSVKASMRWTMAKAAVEFAIDKDTLSKKLTKIAAQPGDDGMFSTGQICEAVFGSMEIEKIRKARADAGIAECKLRVEEGRVVAIEDVSRVWRSVREAIRLRIGESSMTEEERMALVAELRELGANDYAE